LIVVAVESPMLLEAALQAVSRQRLPCAVKLAGGEPQERVLVACNPVCRVRGSDTTELAGAWEEGRARWGAGEPPGIPVGVGGLSYDLGRRFERIPAALPASGWNDIDFRFYDSFAAFRLDTGHCEIWATDDKAARALLGTVCAPPEAHEGELRPRPELVEMEAPTRHLAAVRRALDYVHAGDVYQVNIARRLGCRLSSIRGAAPGSSIFMALERVAPASHAIWLGDAETATAVVGNSPERFLRRSVDGSIETCPIKGTRRRGFFGESKQNAETLLASAKDRAEHVMIVDLERNDLGRVCETGSVRVESLCELMTLPTVYHLVTTVRGRLRPQISLPEILRATFPGGSVTGAPKIRAMQIIEELEPARRGPYTGATGWLGAAGDFDLAVAIRTASIADDWLTLWVGGGIVADSNPEEELDETWAKAQAFSRAFAGD
jgi:para-aminobenzoate synthetase component I